MVDLLALDPLNPRSVLFQLDRLKEEIGLLPGAGSGGTLSPAARRCCGCTPRSPPTSRRDLTPEALDALADDIAGLYNSPRQSTISPERGMHYDIRLTCTTTTTAAAGGGRHHAHAAAQRSPACSA